jgi:hypothetical protein
MIEPWRGLVGRFSHTLWGKPLWELRRESPRTKVGCDYCVQAPLISEARAEPELGAENPWRQVSSACRMYGK